MIFLSKVLKFKMFVCPDSNRYNVQNQLLNPENSNLMSDATLNGQKWENKHKNEIF